MNPDASLAVHHGWQVDNERGLSLAAESDWAEAAEAFAGPADTLARALPANATAHEPLALVLGNLAQAYFRAGRIDDAIQQAQRTCALRVALAGEDGMPVARARMDLAVMLAAAGRVDEAMALVQRAIASIEHRVGDEDARLAIVLENAARIALAGAAPANAEPLLLRLHALLDAHGLSTARAEQLLARIAAVRARQADEARTTTAGGEQDAMEVHAAPIDTLAPASITPVSAVLAEVQRTMAEQESPTPIEDGPALVPDEFSAYLDASMLPDEEWEDQPLRDAVALTDVLLRTTPSGVPIVPEPVGSEPPITELTLDLADEFGSEALGTAADDDLLVDIRAGTPAPAPSDPTPDEATTSYVSGADAIELDLALEVPDDNSLVLGFAVEHGVIDASFDEAPIDTPPVSSPVPDALTAPLLMRPVEYIPVPSQPIPEPSPAPVAPPSPIRRVDITHAAPTSAPPVAPIADMVSTAPPTAAETSAPSRRTADTESASRAPQSTVADKADSSAAPRTRSTPTPDAGGSSKLPFIIGGVIVIGGAAAWFVLR